ncbi:MAG: prepilin-type N-terminal cleavage/methylation domain-containing protein [bacterium]
MKKYELTTSVGFTFIELLVALMLVSVCFIPLMRMFTTSTEQVISLDELVTARCLGQEAMERLKNLQIKPDKLEEMGDIYYPPLDTPPLSINGRDWRVVYKTLKGSSPIKVTVEVYKEYPFQSKDNFIDNQSVLEFVTLIEDFSNWKFENDTLTTGIK